MGGGGYLVVVVVVDSVVVVIIKLHITRATRPFPGMDPSYGEVVVEVVLAVVV